MEWLAVTVSTTAEAEEAVNHILFGEGAKGTVIEEENKRVTAYFPANDDGGSLVERIKKRVCGLKEFGLDIGRPKVVIKRVQDEEWANAWRENYHPFRVTQNIVIKPSWRLFVPQKNDVVIEMDPGMAFGSGLHFTTKSCLVLLEKHVKKGDLVLDVGTGSGILAIAAAKLGAGEVVALDIDEVAVQVAIANVQDNDVRDVVRVIHSSPENVELEKCNMIVANIIAEVIVELLPCFNRLLKDGGTFIGAGIILKRLDAVLEAAEKQGMVLKETYSDEQEQWVSIVCCKGID